ncbi:MAG: hypothetical protein KJO41_01590, partial [Bacteroidia bacterium]|nr:hypothetical protein [Bacteroidia bacterium]
MTNPKKLFQPIIALTFLALLGYFIAGGSFNLSPEDAAGSTINGIENAEKSHGDKSNTEAPLMLKTLSPNAQTCNGNTFNSPGAPSTCTFTYTSSGWENSSGVPIAAPQAIEFGESACILANNSDLIGSSKFKGTLYVAPGVTFSGSVPTFSGGSGNKPTLVIEGTADFSNNPSINDTEIYIHETGSMIVPGQLQPNGASEIHVLGQLENGADLNITGQAEMTIYDGGVVTIANGGQISNLVSNCGQLGFNAGEVHTGGGSSLVNLCSTYIKEDLVLDGPYTNDGLIVIKGDLTFNGHALINNDVLMVKNLYMNNDDIIGNNDTSTLLVEYAAEMVSGSTITGHYFYDNDDGGGFDVVCASCVDEVAIIDDMDMSGTLAEITANCGAAFKPNKIKEKATL